MHTFWQVVYWSPAVVLAALAGISVWRRLNRVFPMFFVFIVVDCARNWAGFIASHRTPRVYFYTYWISHLVSAIFIFLASYELSLTRLFPRFYRVAFYRYLFPFAALIIGATALSTLEGGVSLALVPKIVNMLDILHVAGLLFFVGLMTFMGRNWGRYELGIAAGLGVEASAFIVFFATFLRWGPVRGIVGQLPSLADALASLIWLITFLRPEESTVPSLVSPAVIQEARNWEGALKESVTGKKGS